MSISKSQLLSTALILAAALAGCGDSPAEAGWMSGFGEPRSESTASWLLRPSGAGSRDVPEGSIVLGKHTVHDAGTRGIASHTLLAPENCKKDVRIEWRPAMQMGFVNLIGAVQGKDQREARSHRMVSYTGYESSMRASQPTGRSCATTANGVTFRI